MSRRPPRVAGAARAPLHVLHSGDLGRNVLAGANVSILPGVTIGDNCVIGAGSVATHSIPANSVAYGAPCEVAREIGDKDRECFYKDRKLDVWE